MYSSLTDKVILADSSNYTQTRYNYRICKITPHHMAAVWTAERCAQSFQNPQRNASANYCIGYDGTIVCNVEEQYRAWTSSNGFNDCQAITIEVGNSTGAPSWQISAAAWKSLILLCADVCKRYGFRLRFDGTPAGSLTMHKMFASTGCPGPYMSARMKQLEKEVNAVLDGGKAPEPVHPVSGKYEPFKGFVRVTYDGKEGLALHNKPSWDDATISGMVHGGVYTVIGRQSVDGVYMYKLKSGAWITSSEKYIQYMDQLNRYNKPVPKPIEPVLTVEQVAQDIVNGVKSWGNGEARVRNVTNAGLSYEAVQNRVNELLGIKPSMSARQFALEVWTQGKHGTGKAREAEARKLGVNYDEAKRLIGILANGGSI